jgi:hypothetical protein
VMSLSRPLLFSESPRRGELPLPDLNLLILILLFDSALNAPLEGDWG